MTYLEFHLYFTIPQTILVWILLKLKVDKKQRKQIFLGSSLLAVLAVVWTTPWDNYLIYKNIWWYGPDKVLGTIGYVPIEEYFFFIIQCYFTGGLLGLMINKWGYRRTKNPREGTLGKYVLSLSILILALGVALLNTEKGLYLGLILAWAAPIFLIQQFFGADLLVREWRKTLSCILIPSLYLSACDYIAISEMTWSISEQFTLAWNIGPLPMEEITFFFATNIMLVQGLILFLHPDGRTRALGFLKQLRSKREAS